MNSQVPWWQRQTAEGLEEEKRESSKSHTSEPERGYPQPPAPATSTSSESPSPLPSSSYPDPDPTPAAANPYDRAAPPPPVEPAFSFEPAFSLEPAEPTLPARLTDAEMPEPPSRYGTPVGDPFDTYTSRAETPAEVTGDPPFQEAAAGDGTSPIWTLEPLRINPPEQFEPLQVPAEEENAALPTTSFCAPAAPAHAPDEDLEEDDEEEDDEEEDEDAEEQGATGEGAEGKPAEEREGRRRRSRGRRGGRRRAATRPGEPAEAGSREDHEPEPPLEAPEPPRARRAPQSAGLLHHAPAAAPAAPAPFAPVPRVARSGESFTIPAGDLDSYTREIIISVPERARTASDERKIALFCDLENVALGVRDSEVAKFDINLVLERLLEKGKIIVKKAYADWERYSDFKRPFHEAAIELIDIPQKYYSGKNSADIKMVVDAMDLSYAKEHLDTFVLLSGDSDFSPLVSKLKENNKYVIGIGVKNSSSALLIDNCDEFIFYEDIWRDTQKGPKLDGLNKKTAEAFSLMVESIQALVRENKDVLWGSMIKQTMQRKRPSFNEGYYGYSTFSELLEDAEKKNIIKLKKDQRSGTYIVTGFSKANEGPAPGGRR